MNPKFVKAVTVDYRFEEIQHMKICCYDVDNKSVSLDKQDFIGQVECKLADIVTGSNLNRFVRELQYVCP